MPYVSESEYHDFLLWKNGEPTTPNAVSSPPMTENQEIKALVERLRRTKTEHRVTGMFGGLISVHDETETREVPVNPDGPAAAQMIEHLAAALSLRTAPAMDREGLLREALDDGVATLAAVRASAGSEDWEESRKHFYDLCGTTIRRMNTARLALQGKDEA